MQDITILNLFIHIKITKFNKILTKHILLKLE